MLVKGGKGMLKLGGIYLSLVQCVWAYFPQQSVVPGGVVMVPVQAARAEITPRVWVQSGKEVAVLKIPQQKGLAQQWVAVVGIPLNHTGGKLTLRFDDGTQVQEKFVAVQNKRYPVEHIKIPTKKKTESVSPEYAARIAREQKLMESVLAQWQASPVVSFRLQKPVQGRISGVFGARRIINGDKTFRAHKGLDIAAPAGTPVIAAATGRVVSVGEYLISGKTVILDHGQGFKTLYCHLNEIKVAQDAVLQGGEVLGTVGKTGRATGPHLHFGVSLNNERVAPELFFS